MLSADTKPSGVSRQITFPEKHLLQQCLLADRQALQKRLDGLKRRQRQGQPFERGLEKLWQQIEASRQQVAARNRPVELNYPEELPISAEREQILQLINDHQVLILCGETGSGKSTQLPKFCLESGRGLFGRIGHTQPRRIAARSLAARVAEELQQEVGESVGFKVRFHDQVSPASRVKLMTDGILLAEIQHDPMLWEYDTLIIDEAHERSLNIDFLLGYLKRLLPKRPELKLIVTSATIDPERFSRHFDQAPIINVSGRTYPVELRYRPPLEESEGDGDEPLQQAIVAAVDELQREGPGDILVFLSGEREIRETAEALRKQKLKHTEVLPLYARLGVAEQTRIFHPGGLRRVVLSTNVAETSLTVPGIRYVIDSGYARISRYSHRSKVQRLPVEAISQASANQRMGRCGRVSDGICIRLYDETDFLSRPEFTDPEIQRTNLASVILQMKLLGFGDIASFPFVDPPESRLIRDGYRVLEEIGAVDGAGDVTRIGRQIARLPVDPRIGRMLLSAAHGNCLNEVLVIAAALSVQDPRERPMDKQQAADEVHRQYADGQSDFLSFLKLWQLLQEQRRHLSRRKFHRFCRDSFLNWNRVREWIDIHQQLRLQMHDLGYRDNSEPATYEEIHRALLSGLLSHIGFKAGKKNRGEYLGGRNSRFYIFPGSAQFKTQPKWLMAAEIVETSKLYARTVARIQPEWIESLAGHLVKRSYSEPHWEKHRGQVAANEKVTLFGLVINPRRKINYGPIDPVLSRELFIRFALVHGDFETRAPFWRHNRQLRESLELQEQKQRRRDLLVDEEAIYHYYDQRIPEGIYSQAQFEKWLRETSRNQPKLLHMRVQDLRRTDHQHLDEQDFPDTLDLNGMRLPLHYHFEPGEAHDGVTLLIPREVLNQMSEARAQWLVPGLLEERVTALLRGLPKGLRKSFVPIPETAREAIRALQPSDRPLVQELAAWLKQRTGVHVPEDAWPEQTLADHLRMRFQVLDEKGRALGDGRDLGELQKRFGGEGESNYHQLPYREIEREGIERWDFGSLPESLELDRGGIKLRGYPALVDEQGGLCLRVLDAEHNAREQHRRGLLRLIALSRPKTMRYLKRNLGDIQRMRLQYAMAPPAAEGLASVQSGLEQELVQRILQVCFIDGRDEIRDAETFSRRLEECEPQLMQVANKLVSRVAEVLERYQKLRKQLDACRQINWMRSLRDMREQLDRLVYQGFIAQLPERALAQMPRYLEALHRRLDKLQGGAARDQQRLQQLSPLLERWRERDAAARKSGQIDPRLEEMRWLLEELRISLFAQELGTLETVSIKRLEKRWRELGL